MHQSSYVNWAGTLLLTGLSLTVAGCGGMNQGDVAGGAPAASASTVTTTDALRGHHRPASGGAGSTTGSSGAGGAPATTPPPAAAPTTVDEAIAAARTPDGRAIPQPPNPDGSCPIVLQLLGFWSCPTIGDTCAFSSAGVNHACLCQRTDGEGQNPSWVCDQ